MKQMLLVGLGIIGAVSGSTQACNAQQAIGDEVAIRKAIATYTEAFNKADAKSIAAHWSPEGVYTSRISGDAIVGRDALEQEFASQFAKIKGAKLAVAVDSIQFISPNVALEQGAATLVLPNQSPRNSDYSAVHVKRDGKWLIDRMTDEATELMPSHYEELKSLEWLIGDWTDTEGRGTITTECSWTRNRNFITRSFAVTIEDAVELTGMQFIGWDPHQKQIRAWTFDSDGGFAESHWRENDGKWIAQTVATLPDGRRGSSTSVFRPIDENRFGWQKINRLVDGDILPNVGEIEVVRKGS